MRFLQLRSRAGLENPKTRDESVFAEARELAQQRLEQYLADLQSSDLARGDAGAVPKLAVSPKAS